MIINEQHHIECLKIAEDFRRKGFPSEILKTSYHSGTISVKALKKEFGEQTYLFVVGMEQFLKQERIFGSRSLVPVAHCPKCKLKTCFNVIKYYHCIECNGNFSSELFIGHNSKKEKEKLVEKDSPFDKDVSSGKIEKGEEIKNHKINEDDFELGKRVKDKLSDDDCE